MIAMNKVSEYVCGAVNTFFTGKPRWRGSLILLAMLAIPIIGAHIAFALNVILSCYWEIVLSLYGVFIVLYMIGRDVSMWVAKRRG